MWGFNVRTIFLILLITLKLNEAAGQNDGCGECDPNADCIRTQCQCRDGYVGTGLTCSDHNECADNSHDCDVDAHCENTVGSFNCNCKNGFIGIRGTCYDLDECLSGLYHFRCSTNSDCTNTVGSFTCACKSGFIGDGNICIALDDDQRGFTWDFSCKKWSFRKIRTEALLHLNNTPHAVNEYVSNRCATLGEGWGPVVLGTSQNVELSVFAIANPHLADCSNYWISGSTNSSHLSLIDVHDYINDESGGRCVTVTQIGYGVEQYYMNSIQNNTHLQAINCNYGFIYSIMCRKTVTTCGTTFPFP